MGDGGLAANSAGVLNTYQPSENTVKHYYAGKGQKKKPDTTKKGKNNGN